MTSQHNPNKTSFPLWLILGLVILIGIGGAVTWQVWKPTLPAYVTVTAKRGDIEKVVTAQGRVQPHRYVDIGAQVSGQLKKLHVSLGDPVKKGQLLAEIDAAVQLARVGASVAQLNAQQAQLEEAKAQLKLARLQFDRQKNLREANANSEDDYQIAEAAVAGANAQVKALQALIKQTESSLKEDEATLSYTRIYSPMDGLVATLEVREGATLNANQTAPLLMRIADFSTVTIETEVSEADVPRLSIGMPLYFSPIGDTQQRWSSQLRQILPTPQVLNNVVLYTALFDVENPNGRLMSNMTTQVFFVEVSAQDSLLIPVSALHKFSSRSYQVKLLVNDQVTLRDVTVGVSNRIQAAILSGISEGDQVILNGAKSPTIQSNRSQTPRLF